MATKCAKSKKETPKIPNTDFELTEEGFKKFMGKVHTRFGACFVLSMCIMVPLGICLGLFFITIAIASLVFGIQALVVGS
jgi:hypothetical protein